MTGNNDHSFKSFSQIVLDVWVLISLHSCFSIHFFYCSFLYINQTSHYIIFIYSNCFYKYLDNYILFYSVFQLICIFYAIVHTGLNNPDPTKNGSTFI